MTTANPIYLLIMPEGVKRLQLVSKGRLTINAYLCKRPKRSLSSDPLPLLKATINWFLFSQDFELKSIHL